MTLCAALLRDGIAYLLADSVLTMPRSELLADASSFQETHIQGGERTVEEAAIKVFHLSDDLIAGYSGSVSEAVECLQTLRTVCMETQETTKRIASILHRVNQCEIVLCTRDSSTEAIRLWHLKEGAATEHYEDGAIIMTGNGTQYTPLAGFVNALWARPEIVSNPDHVLASLLAILQARSQRTRSLEIGFGGSYWGMLLDTRGVRHQRDILYVLYDHDESISERLGNPIGVLTGSRDKFAFAYRPGRKHWRLFSDVHHVTNAELNALVDQIGLPQPHYMTFLERNSASLTICARERLDDDGPFTAFYEQGLLRFQFREDVAVLLRRVPNDRNTRTPSFTFIY